MCVLPALRWPPCTPASLPSPAHILGLRPRRGQRPREEASCRDLRVWAPGLLHLHTCQRRQGGQGVNRKPLQRRASAPGFPHTDTCSCVGWRVCPTEATAVHGCPAREPARVQCGTARSGLLEHPARVFIYYSVTFFLNFTLIMIIQEYYLSDKFRVSFLIYNFLLC